jgi:hypothetical protein
LGHPGDLAELALQRGGNRGRHGLGAGALQRCGHRHGREVDLGQRRDGREWRNSQSDETNRHHPQRRCDGALYERLGNIHGTVHLASNNAGVTARLACLDYKNRPRFMLAHRWPSTLPNNRFPPK